MLSDSVLHDYVSSDHFPVGITFKCLVELDAWLSTDQVITRPRVLSPTLYVPEATTTRVD